MIVFSFIGNKLTVLYISDLQHAAVHGNPACGYIHYHFMNQKYISHFDVCWSGLHEHLIMKCIIHSVEGILS